MNKNEIKEFSMLFNSLKPKKPKHIPQDRGTLISVWNEMERKAKHEISKNR